MKKILSTDKVYIGESRIINAGRGVFARGAIKKGEIVERCPVILVPGHETSNLNESVLVTYFFYCGRNKEQIALALGFGSVYNHSYKPNATYKINLTEKVIEFVALNDIKEDEEITFNYKHGNPKNKNPLWFEVG